jgi:hypothetical protein
LPPHANRRIDIYREKRNSPSLEKGGLCVSPVLAITLFFRIYARDAISVRVSEI